MNFFYFYSDPEEFNKVLKNLSSKMEIHPVEFQEMLTRIKACDDLDYNPNDESDDRFKRIYWKNFFSWIRFIYPGMICK